MAEMLAGMGVRYATTYRGREVEVELAVPPSGSRQARARLRVDGAEVAEESVAWPLGGRLTGDDVTAVVRWWWPGHLSEVSVVEKPAKGERRPLVLPMEPSPGAPGAALPRFRHDHPRLLAARHVVAAVLQVLVPLLGLSFAFRLGLSIPLPDWNLPRPDLPDLPDLPLPDLPDLPDLALPERVRDVIRSWKWWGPVLIALVVAATEVDRRRKAREAPDADGRDGREGDAR